MSTKVGVFGSHLLSRQMLTRTFQSDQRFLVVGEFGCHKELTINIQRLDLNLLIVDSSNEGLTEMNAIRDLRQAREGKRVLLVTASSTLVAYQEILAAGVHGVISREVSLEHFLHVAIVVAEGGTYFDNRIASNFGNQSMNGIGPSLSNRERQVLQLIASGHSTKEVATMLGLSTKTVEHHRAHLMQKLEVHDVVRLTHFAIRAGLVRLQAG